MASVFRGVGVCVTQDGWVSIVSNANALLTATAWECAIEASVNATSDLWERLANTVTVQTTAIGAANVSTTRVCADQATLALLVST